MSGAILLLPAYAYVGRDKLILFYFIFSVQVLLRTIIPFPGKCA